MKKPLTLAATVATLALSLSACGSHSNPGSANAGAEPGGQTQQGMGQNAAGGRFPGASGKIAAVSGKTAQVQSTDSQTAVTWTSATTFTQEKSVSKSAVKVGACVMAMPAMPSSPDSAGSSESSDSSTVAAATVRIVSASGDCTSGLGGGRPSFSGAPSGMPSGGPSGMSSGAPGGNGPQMARFRAAFGKVTAVSGGGFTVTSSIGGQSSTVEVTTSSSTSYTANAEAAASAVKVGLCMTARGKTDSTGAVTAATVTLSKPAGGTCTGGFGVFRGGPGAQGGPNGSSGGNA